MTATDLAAYAAIGFAALLVAVLLAPALVPVRRETR